MNRLKGIGIALLAAGAATALYEFKTALDDGRRLSELNSKVYAVTVIEKDIAELAAAARIVSKTRSMTSPEWRRDERGAPLGPIDDKLGAATAGYLNALADTRKSKMRQLKDARTAHAGELEEMAQIKQQYEGLALEPILMPIGILAAGGLAYGIGAGRRRS